MKKIVIICALVLIAYSQYSWEWSVMDDPGYVYRLSQSIAEKSGVLPGIIYNFTQHREVDLQGGVFRPGFWAYTSIVYLFPPAWVYTSRLLGLMLMLFFSADALRRMRAPANPSFGRGSQEKEIFFFLFVGLLSIRSLYDGLALVVTQEFCGIFLSCLGVWLFSLSRCQSKTLANLCITACFVLAVSFKPPFVWLILSLGLFSAFRREWIPAAIQAACFVALLGISSYMASRGAYTGAILHFSAENLFSSLASFFKHSAAPILISILAVLYWHRSLSLKNFTLRPWLWSDAQWMGVIFFFSGGLYLGTMLPRGIVAGLGYYLSPMIFFLYLGLVFFVSETLRPAESRPATRTQTLLAIGAVLIAAMVFTFSFYKMWKRNEAVRGLTSWALTLPQSGVVLAGNSREVSSSLTRLWEARSGGTWQNTFLSLTESDPMPENLDYYVVFSDQVPPKAEAQKTLVFKTGLASVYQQE